jgi:hypothetical protein
MTIHNANLLGARESIAAFGGDLSRSFLFSVDIPAIFGNNATSAVMTVFCASTSVPSYSLKSKVIPGQLQTINVVEGCKFDNWNVDFLSDDRHIIRSNLLTWAGVAWDYNRKGAASPNSYKRTLTVSQLDLKGKKIAVYTLVGSYPETVGDYKVLNGGHEFVKFQASFKIDYFTLNKIK